MFEVLGLAGRLAGHGCPIRAIKVGDGAPDSGRGGELDFVTADGDPPLGTMVENRQLRLALAAALADAPLAGLSMPAAVVSRAIAAHGVTLTLAEDRKRVGYGTSGSVRVNLGGTRRLKKQTSQKTHISISMSTLRTM